MIASALLSILKPYHEISQCFSTVCMLAYHVTRWKTHKMHHRHYFFKGLLAFVLKNNWFKEKVQNIHEETHSPGNPKIWQDNVPKYLIT